MDEKEKIKYVAAFTYGDGYIGFHGKECRFQANNIIDNLDYINWRKEKLSEITTTTLSTNADPRPNRKEIIKTFTHTHPIFTKVHSRMYLNNRKVIDPHYLKLFDWETLAILYMDDGSLRIIKQEYKNKHYEYGVPTIATNNFSYGDQMLLKKAIKESLGIEFNINKHQLSVNGEQQYNLILARSSVQKFYDNIQQYILPSFKYKICPYDRPQNNIILGDDIVRTL